MTEKHYRVERSKLDVKDAESKMREAESNYDKGCKKAKFEMDRECIHLKEELERVRVKVGGESAYLKYAESELERGYGA